MRFLVGSLRSALATRMALAAIGGIAISIAGFMIIGPLIGRPVLLKGVDYAAIRVFCLLGILFGLLAARSLAQQIVSPIHAIGAAASRITDNDLTARAEVAGGTLVEVRDLAQDFNTMAARLEHLASERKQWRDVASHELRTPLMVLRGHVQGGSTASIRSTPNSSPLLWDRSIR